MISNRQWRQEDHFVGGPATKNGLHHCPAKAALSILCFHPFWQCRESPSDILISQELPIPFSSFFWQNWGFVLGTSFGTHMIEDVFASTGFILFFWKHSSKFVWRTRGGSVSCGRKRDSNLCCASQTYCTSIFPQPHWSSKWIVA